MKFSLLSLLAVSAAATSVRDLFEEFKAKHGVAYRSTDEHDHRFAIFAENVKENSRKNAILKAKGADEVHGVTKFSDLTQEEFEKMMLGGRYTAEDFPTLNIHSGNWRVADDATG